MTSCSTSTNTCLVIVFFIAPFSLKGGTDIVTIKILTTNKTAKYHLSYCAVPENIHTPPTEGIGIFWGVGDSVGPKNSK